VTVLVTAPLQSGELEREPNHDEVRNHRDRRTREAGSVVTADPLETGHPGCTKVLRDGERRS
jgi:hypothetical protein